MKQSLLLALWGAGALASPGKPARDVTHKDYDLPSAPSTYFVTTQSAQDTTVETHIASGSDGETATFAGDATSPLPVTGTATGIAGQPSEHVNNTGSPSDGSGLTNSVGATETDNIPGQSGDDATQLPATVTDTDIIGKPSGDVDNTIAASSDASSLADGVAATETTTDGAVPTEEAPETVSNGDASGDVTGSAGLTEGQPHATGDATDGTADVSAITQNSDFTVTGLPGSPDETISPSGTDAQGVHTETSTTGVGNTSQDIAEATGIAPEKSSEIPPVNTDVNEQTTTGSVTEKLPAHTDTVVSTDANDVSTSAITGPETTVASAEQTPTSAEQTRDNGSNKTADLVSDNTSTVDATTTEGAQPDETDVVTQPATDVDDITTRPAGDNSDTTKVEVSSDNDVPSTAIGVTTTDAAVITDRNNDTPSTTAPNGNGPSVTSNTAPVITTTAGDAPFPTVTDAPEGFAASTVSGHPEWTSNTWITTTSGDSSELTIVPVLVGCKNCGGSGSGIILWNFPKTPDTWFKLPGLPKFTFPCIPPGCSTPSTTSESDNNDDGEDDEDDETSSTTCTDKASVLRSRMHII
ncbi:hypothetical protein FVEN_g7775 [Fusarium venenatum]|nr:hypothetical protein FVEN_g7775 [Fusarium venenatum]